MIYYLIIFFFLFSGLLAYKCYWQPKKLHKWYVENFRKQGYRVLEVPFRPFAITFLDNYDFTENTTDGFKAVKEKYPGHDVVVMNILSRISIDLMHPDLVQKFLSVENFQSYQKDPLDIEFMKRSIGEGLLLSEGKKWKMKRKVLNAVFNFDFVKSLTFRIANICDSTLDLFEKECQNGEYSLSDYTSRLTSNMTFDCFFSSKF